MPDINEILELIKNPALQTLKLDSTFNRGLREYIGVTGAVALANELIVNTTLQALTLGNNQICDVGTRAIAAALMINNSLLTLDLRYNNIGIESIQDLASSLKTNIALQTLILDDNKIGDTGALALADALNINHSIKVLNLYCNQITTLGATALADALKINTTLETLTLDGNNIGITGAQALAGALTKNVTLRILNLNQVKMFIDGTQSIFEALQTNQTLRALNLGSNAINNVGIQTLADALLTNTSLQELALAHNDIGDTNTQVLAEALKINTSLQTINLSGNKISDIGALALADALLTNNRLRTLNLSYNNIGNIGIKALADSLKTNKSLQTLNLECLQCGLVAAQALGVALKTNATLQSLSLFRTRIDGVGVQEIADALKTNTTLRILNFAESDIGAIGIQLLADALTVNTTLHTLDVRGNNYSDLAVRVLLRALANNYTLLQLEEDSQNPLIQTYLNRNKEIQSLLTCFDAFLADGLLDFDLIQENILKLKRLVPELTTNLSSLPTYIVECYRLLSVLGQLSCLENEDAFVALIEERFEDVRLHAFIDKAIANAVMYLNGTENASSDEKMARYQLLAYHSRNTRDSVEFKSGLIGLQRLERFISIDDMTLDQASFIGASQLLDYQEILILGQQAVTQLHNQHSPEGQLLNELLKQRSYDSTAVGFFWQSPAFQQILQIKYPDKTTFRLLENYLLSPATQREKVDILTLEPDKKTVTGRALLAYQSLHAAELRSTINLPSFDDLLQQAKNTMVNYILDMGQGHMKKYL